MKDLPQAETFAVKEKAAMGQCWADGPSVSPVYPGANCRLPVPSLPGTQNRSDAEQTTVPRVFLEIQELALWSWCPQVSSDLPCLTRCYRD